MKEFKEKKIKFDKNSQVRIRVITGEQILPDGRIVQRWEWREPEQDIELGSINNPKIKFDCIEVVDTAPRRRWFDKKHDL